MQTLPSAPPTRVETVVDEVHGRQISDPYRWLEDAASPETTAWVEQQNAYTRELLDRVPGRETIHRRLAELLAIGSISAPEARGNRYFFSRHEGRNQPLLYVRDGREGTERVLLDPNEASAEGTVALDWWYPSWDGRLLAYGYSADGDEWSTLHVIEVDSGRELSDRIERTRNTTLAWLPDASGFYFTRYPAPGEVPAGEENYYKRVFFHALGSDPADDPLVFGADLAAEQIPSVSISPDGHYLLVTVSTGWIRSDLWLRDVFQPDAPFRPIVEGKDALFSAQFGGDVLYVHTNLGAPRYRVLQVEPARPEREAWREIIPEGSDKLESITLAGGRIVALSLHNATSALALYEPDGSKLADIALPGLGSVTEVTGRWEDLDAFFRFESFVVPPTVYRLSPTGDEPAVWMRIEAPIQTEDYEVRQEWYPSRDGTRISLFLVHRRGLDRDRSHPTLLTGYGGFNISRTPLFDRGMYLWLEHGGILALPNLRGGGEYGEEWHRAGMLDRKQNVFDDFIGAAEYVIARGYTDPSRLAILGGSNGGLLVGAALTQRPDLFHAVVCAVPLLDMLRYHHFLIARLWVPEYGSADEPDQFPFLYAYSPYHQVEEGRSYPAVLLMTAESDSRVDPMHARKMAARLQAANASERPILLRVEFHAGHGIGKPLTKLVESQTDSWCFLFWQLGVTV